jgi:hypothetical protein
MHRRVSSSQKQGKRPTSYRMRSVHCQRSTLLSTQQQRVCGGHAHGLIARRCAGRQGWRSECESKHIVREWREGMGNLTTAPVIMVVLSSARPTPIARPTCPAWEKDSMPTIASARGPVSAPGIPDCSTSATMSTNIAWKNVVRISHDRLRVLTRCASPNMKLPTRNL